jgi:hypothetical protein
LEILAFLIVRNHLPMHLVESQWFKKIVCIYIQGLFSLLKNNFQEKFCQSWWKKKNSYMSYLLWQIVIM